jgi:hypothetical protein
MLRRPGPGGSLPPSAVICPAAGTSAMLSRPGRQVPRASARRGHCHGTRGDGHPRRRHRLARHQRRSGRRAAHCFQGSRLHTTPATGPPVPGSPAVTRRPSDTASSRKRQPSSPGHHVQVTFRLRLRNTASPSPLGMRPEFPHAHLAAASPPAGSRSFLGRQSWLADREPGQAARWRALRSAPQPPYHRLGSQLAGFGKASAGRREQSAGGLPMPTSTAPFWPTAAPRPLSQGADQPGQPSWCSAGQGAG